MAGWEYQVRSAVMGPKILNSSGGFRWLDVEAFLDTVDQERWELVSVVPVGWDTSGLSDEGVGQDVIVFLRRPRPSHLIDRLLGRQTRSARPTGTAGEGRPGG